MLFRYHITQLYSDALSYSEKNNDNKKRLVMSIYLLRKISVMSSVVNLFKLLLQYDVNEKNNLPVNKSILFLFCCGF